MIEMRLRLITEREKEKGGGGENQRRSSKLIIFPLA